MATQVSPGIIVRERDFTNSRIQETITNIGAIAGPFTKGEVGVAKLITNEKELVETFGKPDSNNYESWYTASEFLNYGGNLQVARITEANAAFLTNANSGSVAGVRVNSEDEYETNIEGTVQSYDFLAKNPGTWGNSLKVITIDAGADQILTLASGVTVAKGAAVTDGTATGIAYEANTSDTTKIAVVLDPASARFVSGGSVSGVSVDSVVDWYDQQEATTGINWNAIAPRPGTSPFVAQKGGSNDEIHVVIVDEDGKLTGVANSIVEKILFVSKASDAKTTEGETNFYRDVIRDRSKYIYLTAYETTSVYTEGGLEEITANSDSTTNFSLLAHKSYSFGGGLDYETYDVSDSTQTYLDVFSDSETIQIDYILAGPCNLAKANSLINIATNRKDCIAFISPKRTDVIGSDASTATKQKENVVEFFESISDSSSYAVFDSNYKYIYDRFNDAYRWIPCNADVAGLCVNAATIAEPWYSPAGFNRGNLRNAIKVAFNPTKQHRDELYAKRINPIATFPGQGIVLFGDKTALRSPSAFDRINVRRLFLIIERSIKEFSRGVLFELNDESTRSNFTSQVENFMRDIQARRGMTDFLVVADTTNNTADVIDRNEFVADIYIKPSRSINFITLTFVATRTGVSFNEVIGRV